MYKYKHNKKIEKLARDVQSLASDLRREKDPKKSLGIVKEMAEKSQEIRVLTEEG